MKRILVIFLVFSIAFSLAACGDPEATGPVPSNTQTAPTQTNSTDASIPESTSTATKPSETEPPVTQPPVVVDWNEQDYWSITNVTSQGVYLMGESLPMRVYYVTGPCRVTLLTNLDDPSQWGYTGAYLGITDDGWNVKYDYAALKEHGKVQYYTDSYGDTWFAAGTYYDLPTGTWYFGNVEASSSFFVVVNNPTAEANGTLG